MIDHERIHFHSRHLSSSPIISSYSLLFSAALLHRFYHGPSSPAGMIRSSVETNLPNNVNDSGPNSPAKSDKGDSQFTPAVRQFSAPKASKDAE